MKCFIENIKNSLNNENAGPSVETLIGVAVAMAIGVGLFILGRSIALWYRLSSKEIERIEIAYTPEI